MYTCTYIRYTHTCIDMYIYIYKEVNSGGKNIISYT